MITYVPYIGFAASARQLDDRRVRRQRKDAWQLLQVLLGQTEEYANHPAVGMWKNYERWLCVYGLQFCQEWRIGRKQECDFYARFYRVDEELKERGFEARRPPWVGDIDLCRSHRSSLIRQVPSYAEHWPNTPELMPYLWPHLDSADPRGYRLRLAPADVARLERGERKLPEWLEYDRDKREVVES